MHEICYLPCAYVFPYIRTKVLGVLSRKTQPNTMVVTTCDKPLSTFGTKRLDVSSCLCGCFGHAEDRVEVGVDHLKRAKDDGGDEDKNDKDNAHASLALLGLDVQPLILLHSSALKAWHLKLSH